MHRIILRFFGIPALFACFSVAMAASVTPKYFIQYMHNKHHFDPTELTLVLNSAVYQPQIITSMEKPYEKKTWNSYKRIFLTPQRLEEGLKFWQNNAVSLNQAEKRYNVPASIIVAILGVETLYGKKQGDYRVLDSLTTLAFHYPKRSAFFTKELEEYLLLCREQGLSPTYYTGSYAGAIGQPQFMPSSYRYYAATLSGAAKKDLVHDTPAVIASVANYLHKHGWQLNQGITQAAIIHDQNALRYININHHQATYPLKHLTQLGIQPLTAALHQPHKAGVIALTTKKGQEYWLTYPNFYVITRYNTSPQYAMVVYLLSNQLQRHWAFMHQTKHYQYS